MITNLDIDPDVLAAAKEMASASQRSAGQVLSELAQQSLVSSKAPPVRSSVLVNGFEVMAAEERIVSAEFVRKLLEGTEAS